MNRIETNIYGDLSIPYLGCGTWQITKADDMKSVVKEAYSLGYRLFDIAAAYSNEITFRKAIAENNIPRDELLISDKVWNTSRGYEKVREACKASLHKIKTDYLDFYLIHWPASKKLHDNWEEINADTWRGMESLVYDGLVRNIGVCNFKKEHLKALQKTSKIKPVIDQIEFHPGYMQAELYNYCLSESILIEASSPLGNGQILSNSVLKEIAATKNKSTAQICLRWAIQKKVTAIPKTTNTDRLNDYHFMNKYQIMIY